jgi:DNA-binding NtrC family response regulator
VGNHRIRDRVTPRTVLIVEDDRQTAQDLRNCLSSDFACCVAHTGPEAIAIARDKEIAALLVDLDLGDSKIDGFDVIREIRAIDSRVAVVVVTNDASVAAAEKARDLDVQDYFEKSIGPVGLRAAVRRSMILRRVAERCQRLEDERSGGGSLLVAESTAMMRVASEVATAARHLAPVLIRGPIGAGKMVVAKEIHRLSRARRPFERAHCATLDAGDLVDSILFGCEPGSHSMAHARQIGLFERAENGTVLLDDIDYLAIRVQEKLLQPLQERFIRRLGGGSEIAIHCRILVTTNKNLEDLASKGVFRADLLDRLRGGQEIVVPPISERLEDMPGLVRAFSARAAGNFGRKPPIVTEEFLEAVRARSWRDAREMEHSIEYATGVSEDGILSRECLPPQPHGSAANVEIVTLGESRPHGSLNGILSRSRLEAVQAALTRNNGDKVSAARELQITVQWLNQVLRDSRQCDSE